MVSLNINLPEGFLDEENRCDYTISSKMKEVWAVELDLLAKLQEICKKHDIQYFADGGTLLGCARHKGFIPWDDDIDIAMTREHYEKFCKVARNECHHPYFLQTEKTDPGTVDGYAKLCNSGTAMILKCFEGRNFKYNQGISIDIFPLDKLPNNETEMNDFLSRLQALRAKGKQFRNRLHNDEGEHNFIKTVLAFFVKLFHIKNYPYFKFERECQKYNSQDTKYMASISYRPVREIGLCEVELYKELIELPFEFITLPCPKNFDQYLTDFYGEWRKFKKGTSFHGDVFFDTDKSYTEYINKTSCGDKKSWQQ